MKWLISIVIAALLVAGVMWFDSVRRNRPTRVEVATRKGIFLVGNGSEPKTLDPHLATGQPEHEIFIALFEGLVAPAVHPDEDAPGVASSWEQKDYTVWTFHLRPEAKWSDGVPLTSADFVWSFQRMLEPALAGEYASMLYPIKNAEEYNKGKIKDFSQVGVEAPDAHTLRLTLVGPTPYLPGMLKHYSWFPVPRHVIERFGKMTDRDTHWTDDANMVSNGPFKLRERRFTHSISVERNPYYWDAQNVKLNGIRFYPIASDNTEERSFADGQLHLTLTMPLAKIPVYEQAHSPAFHHDPLLSVYFYRVNVTNKLPDGRPHPLTDKRVRKALALAVDRDSLINNVLQGGQKPAVGFVPYPDSIGYPNAPKVMRFDPNEARKLLAEAGFPDGQGFPTFEILINTSEGHKTIAETLQEMWRKELHIPVKIHNQDWGVYLQNQMDLKYDVCRAGWVGDYLDPSTFLQIWKTGDGNNETGWSNARYDQLYDASTKEADPKKRMEELGEAESILLDELPIIPIYWYTHDYLLSPEVKNWHHSVLEQRSYKSLELVPSSPK